MQVAVVPIWKGKDPKSEILAAAARVRDRLKQAGLSVRLDDDEDFGTELTGNAGLQWLFGERWRAYANAGRAFRAPTFSQLFSPGFGGLFAGNPDLDPERSWSTEAGLDFRPSDGARPSSRWATRRSYWRSASRRIPSLRSWRAMTRFGKALSKDSSSF